MNKVKPTPEQEKKIWQMVDDKHIFVGELVSVNMFGEPFDMNVFFYNPDPLSKPSTNYDCKYLCYGLNAINVMDDNDAVSKNMDYICAALIKEGVL